MNLNQQFIGYSDRLDEISGTNLIDLTLLEKKTVPLGLFNILTRTWRGETDKDKYFYLLEHNGVINIGLDERELRAKNLKRIGLFLNFQDLTIQEILETLRISYDWNKYIELF